MLNEERTTIVAPATGTPDGGVAIVRLSGPRALEIAGRCVRGSVPGDRRLRLRRIGPALVGGRDGAATDQEPELEEGLVVAMLGPGTFTGEDVVELHVHGGAINVQQVLGWLTQAGAILAQAGEFTRRAFESGRLTLDQAEGIAAVIGARTETALDHARRLVAGELRRDVESVRDDLHRLRLDVEGAIGFPEDVDEGEAAHWAAQARALAMQVESWLRRFEAGRRARAKARIVLAGAPNAGKSALFNALLGRSRALVADVAGTTRDFIEADLRLGRRDAVLVDTAGLRETGDVIEAAGVALTRDQLEGADVVVWVAGSDQAAHAGTEADVRDELRALIGPGAALLLVETKRDLATQRGSWVGVSRDDPESVTRLRERIATAAAADDDGWIGLARHRDRAEEARRALLEAATEFDGGVERLEIAALPLMEASTRLGEIVGVNALGAVGDDVLRDIFSRFCIGK